MKSHRVVAFEGGFSYKDRFAPIRHTTERGSPMSPPTSATRCGGGLSRADPAGVIR